MERGDVVRIKGGGNIGVIDSIWKDVDTGEVCYKIVTNGIDARIGFFAAHIIEPKPEVKYGS